MNRILAFESSCDDTSVAIVGDNYEVICNLVSTQTDHADFGGVLPELASRLHLQNILHLTEAALGNSGLRREDIAALAVSINPGLIGSLIVGLAFAKSLAWSWHKPLITVNHMLSHIFANFIEHPRLRPPFLALVVSGGHTELVHFSTLTDFTVVGKTLDDAAGETFDKTAKLLGLGFPGGPELDRAAQSGDPAFHNFPRALKRRDDMNFSYSGLKTAVLEYLARHEREFVAAHLPDLAASIQQAIIDPLIGKSLKYALEQGLDTILLAGGVAANSALRKQLSASASARGIEVCIPSQKLCVDNAAMVGAAAIPKLREGQFAALDVNAFSTKGTKTL
ncbi:MAG: tRNA (adenosine(37)-N6)-threonylcarbamoyltransferase complex transferase subunit TsaD [Candidatus Cloacimonetes bacterium]|jgi:N6-L-threonylcarbamoyladenine synthase|nr:tRNA (adenosine(37)-N6)-threonylcarbamoyltransferase complex transferase subunit TsaD [Candidatus Cloacimonadota bacterium]MDD3144162.1 tRNA (adenosine(37)-N6)-threonylcarbamoyltransferase complex transferase subunit TsaD [Candidatus Cloacimonadota bacterium]MDY0366505.1 tRNA (adenosine(37)-N6)-threonylcarbamoyltransferase complex transferase subunit TsaD [Candidatus Syntrophosphaera sp.]HOY85228.1 tRNA (adenosine(37)-N6)-threonylcarbamoyltransferase complex transferase subunit TsaD [Candidat